MPPSGPCSLPIMKEENMGLPNPYTLAETLEKLRYVLTEEAALCADRNSQNRLP